MHNLRINDIFAHKDMEGDFGVNSSSWRQKCCRLQGLVQGSRNLFVWSPADEGRSFYVRLVHL
jgi:hypothetical protein